MNCGFPSELKYPSSLLRQLPRQKLTKVPCISRIIHNVWRGQSNAAVKSGQPGRIQRVIHVAPPTPVSGKISVGLGESYEPDAFHSNGNWQTQQRLPPKKFLNTLIEINDWLHASCSYATLASPYKFWPGNGGAPQDLRMRGQFPYSNHVHKPTWLTRSWLNWKSGVLIRALALMGSSLRSSKPSTPILPLYLHKCLTFHSKLPRSLKISVAQ